MSHKGVLLTNYCFERGLELTGDPPIEGNRCVTCWIPRGSGIICEYGSSEELGAPMAAAQIGAQVFWSIVPDNVTQPTVHCSLCITLH